MSFNALTDTISVCGQISVEQVSEVKAAGFKTIMCNRPDNEEYGQPAMLDIQTEAEQLGLVFIPLPASGSEINPETATIMAAKLREAPTPILTYCRTGTRCTALWAMFAATDTPVDQVLAQADQAGYNMSMLRPLLESLSAD